MLVSPYLSEDSTMALVVTRIGLWLGYKDSKKPPEESSEGFDDLFGCL